MEWAKVWEEQSNVHVSIGSKRIWSFDPTHVGKNRAEFMAEQTNSALDSHPEILRLREVEKAAEKMALALKESSSYIREDCWADIYPLTQEALEAYDKVKSPSPPAEGK